MWMEESLATFETKSLGLPKKTDNGEWGTLLWFVAVLVKIWTRKLSNMSHKYYCDMEETQRNPTNTNS
jgi:hypothetical protein